MKLTVRPPGRLLTLWLQKIRRRIRSSPRSRWPVFFKCCACGFLLGAAGVRTTPLPLAVGLLASLDFGLLNLLVCVSCVSGTLAFWGLRAGSEPAAVLFLVFLAQALFEGTAPKKTRWLMPCLASAVTAVVGVAFLLEGTAVARSDLSLFLLRIALSGCSALFFTQARRARGTPADWFAAGALVLSLAQLLLFSKLDLGLVLAAILTCTAPPGLAALPLAAACGLALDLARITPVILTPVLCLSALGAAAAPKKRLRFFFPTLLSFPFMLLWGEFDALVPISLATGGAVSLFLPRSLIPQPVQERPGSDPDAAARLQSVADVLSQIQATLMTENGNAKHDDAAAIFDQATDQVCRSCIHFSLCWERSGAETYHLLSSCAPELLEKGTAHSEDLPAAFLERCRQPGPFLEAVNQALFAHRCQNKCRAQLAESRTVLCSQYQFLASYLTETAEHLDAPAFHCATARYRPDIGIRALGKYGQAVSGDRGACFAGPGSLYYVLLCDGMGTGLGAAQESESAMRLLTGLLQAGLSAGAALEMLNGLYVLRSSGGFSTADLLELHLDSGRASLYKWGAAPSYIKHQGYAKKVGTAAPPPGLGIGGSCRAEVIRLSLTRGETVVLVSDGVSGEETRLRIAGFADRSPKALANYIIAGAGADGEDDMTAVAVCLRPLTSTTQ